MRIGRVLGPVLVAGLLAGCGAGGRDGSVTADELRQEQPFYQGEHLGETVTLAAEVAEVRGPTVVELAATGGTLTVLTRAEVSVAAGTAVRVTGTVGQLHSSVPSDMAPYVQEPLYAEATTRPYLYDAVVEAR